MGGYRIPGPAGLHMRRPDDDEIVGTLRDLQKDLKEIGNAASVALDFAKGNVLQILADIYRASDVPSGDGDGNATDLVG